MPPDAFLEAAAELDGALMVNPHETEGMAAAMKAALLMPRDERQSRHASMFARIEHNDIAHWVRSFLERLTESTKPTFMAQILSLFS